MFDDFFEKPHKRKIDELNVVPILDMLMSVIFFLLLSTTLIGYTKLEIPPAKISEESQLQAVPLSPKLMVRDKGDHYELQLKWQGERPSTLVEKVDRVPGDTNLEKNIRESSEKLASEFLDLYPQEKTIQVGLAEMVNYQVLISVMDGLKTRMQDVVLFSYLDVKNSEKE